MSAAADLQARCAELLPGYSTASREPWRSAVLTAACLAPGPRRPSATRPAEQLVVHDVEQPSDVLCALWLARHDGHFHPGSSCGDGIGRRSLRAIEVGFAETLAPHRRRAVLAALRANAAWRVHVEARAQDPLPVTA
jgi:hypothetical protein